MMYLDALFLCCFGFRVSCIIVALFDQIWKKQSQYFFKYSFLQPLFFSWDFDYMYAIPLDAVILATEALLYFSVSLSLYFGLDNFCWLIFMFTDHFFFCVQPVLSWMQWIFYFRYCFIFSFIFFICSLQFCIFSEIFYCLTNFIHIFL